MKHQSTEFCLGRFEANCSIKRLRELAAFCGVKTPSALLWFEEKQPPKGEALIRLRVFLDLFGFTPIELTVLPEITKDLVEMIAFGVYDIGDVIDAMEYPTTSGLYNVLLKGTGLSAERETVLVRLVDDGHDELEKKKFSYIEQLHPDAELDCEPQCDESELLSEGNLSHSENSSAAVSSTLASVAMGKMISAISALMEASPNCVDDPVFVEVVTAQVGKHRLENLREAIEDL